MRFWNINPVISSYINSSSRALYVRGVHDRVGKIAPFLSLDADPYPIIVDGGVKYVVDGYTTTDRYPYSQRKPDLIELSPSSGLKHNFNYVRNSVKVVVDAYDGTVDLYVVDGANGTSDPIIAAYQKAFPKLFKPMSEMPDSIRSHLRHPEDMFRVQTSVYGTYRVDAPDVFYSETQRWEVSQQPATETKGRTTTTAATSAVPIHGAAPVRTNESRMVPQYLQLQLPGEESPSFVIMRSFVPVSANDEQRKLTGFMVAKPDGRLVAYSVPGAELAGPTLISANIDANTEVSKTVSLLDQRGSKVQFGNLLLLPVKNSVLWVRPLFVQADVSNSVPELEAVIVVYGQRIVQAPTLQEALGLLFGKTVDTKPNIGVPEQPPTGSTTTTIPPGPSTATTGPTKVDGVADWAKQAQDALAQAELLLRGGDLGGYKAKVDEAKKLIERIAAETQPKVDIKPGNA